MIFTCDDSYKADMTQYMKNVIERYGVITQSAEREIICLAETGNVVAAKLYADMIFHKKLLKKNPYRDAFYEYLKAAGISIISEEKWLGGKKAYPLAYCSLGQYLVNYRRESILKNCELIPELEDMTLVERMALAFSMALSGIEYIKAPEVVNLLGRILKEISLDEELYNALGAKAFLELDLSEGFKETIAVASKSGMNIEDKASGSPDKLREYADILFENAAREGYVYACNSLALREADKIIELSHRLDTDPDSDRDSDSAKKEMDALIKKYVEYLGIAADRYEPYAANRLGLFYRTGEILGTKDKIINKEYMDHSLAKEYFKKATVYHNSNSAWAYLNLIKYYYKDYEKDIDLMNEHMEYIKMLNKEVYDIAMEL